MSLATNGQEQKALLDYIERKRPIVQFNDKIFQIMEGNLAKFVLQSMSQQLSVEHFEIARQRLCPLNVFNKIMDKLSRLYINAPERMTANEVDQRMVDFYSESGTLDNHFMGHNRGFNAYKQSSLEMYYDPQDRAVKFRAIPANSYVVWSNDKVNPLRMTHYVKFMGQFQKQSRHGSKQVERMWVWTDEEFISIDSDGDLIMQDMDETQGVNQYGVIPFSYVNRSRNLLVPDPDEDNLQLSVNIPVLLTDLNFAHMFQSFGAIYLLDIDAENLKLSPNSILNLKSADRDGETGGGSIGTIKPQVDIDETIRLIKFELDAWMESKNLRAGTAGGSLSADNAASGVSLMIQNADVNEDRKEQEKYFKENEVDFWKRLAKVHNRLAETNQLEMRERFQDENLVVNVDYQLPKPMESEDQKISKVKMAIEAGILSKRTAIEKVYPDWDEERVDLEIERMNEEGATSLEVIGGVATDQG